MTELEQRLINDLSRLAEQYEREQKQQSEQVKSLSEDVQELAEQYERGQRELAEQYERGQRELAEQVKTLKEHMMRLGEHVTVLTNAYEGLQKNVNAMIDVSNNLARDMSELFR